MLANGGVGVREDDAFVGQLFLKRAVDHFRFKLSLHTGKVLSFGFGNAELFESVFDLLRNVVPAFTLLVGRFQVIENILKVQVDIAAPLGHRLAVENLQRFQTELPHPIGLVLDVRNLVHDFRIDSLPSLEDGSRLGLKIVLIDIRRAPLLVFG